MTYGNTSLDLASGMLICGKKQIRLSAKEFDIMRFLMQTRERNLSKETILARVWGFESNAVENHVEVYIGFLRKKLTSIGSNVRIEAVRRLGYHLEVDESCSLKYMLPSKPVFLFHLCAHYAIITISSSLLTEIHRNCLVIIQ